MYEVKNKSAPPLKYLTLRTPTTMVITIRNIDKRCTKKSVFLVLMFESVIDLMA
jgi:hypothetical protein